MSKAAVWLSAAMLATIMVPGAAGGAMVPNPAGSVAEGPAQELTGEPHPADVFAFFSWEYVPSTVTITQGTSFKFGNYDYAPWGAGIAGHSLDEVVPGCTAPPYTANNANGGECRYPRFTSGLVDHGHVRKVSGVETLPTGSYEFTCQVHPFMRGTLVVQ